MATLKFISQPFVIDSQKMEKRRLEVVNVNAVACDIEADIVALAIGHPRLNSSPGHPNRKSIRMMIAAPAFALFVVALQKRSTPEFAAPDDERIIKHPTLF